MRNKIASYNRVSDKGMDLIAKISQMNDLVKSLILSDDENILDSITGHAKLLEASVVSYQNCLVSAVEEIMEDDIPEENKVDAIKADDGFRLN